MKKHIFVTSALIFENEKVFAAKRGDYKYAYVAHKYEFVGGKIEEGETEQAALKRELKEEMDMEVAVGSLYAKLTHEYPDFIITLSVYECERLSDFTLKEHEGYAWISPKDLKVDDWAPADATVLETIKRVFGEQTNA